MMTLEQSHVRVQCFLQLALLSATLMVACWVWSARADVADLPALRENSTVASGSTKKPLLVEQFVRHDPRYVERRATFNERLNVIADRIVAAEADNRSLVCTRPIYEEVKWLVYYTAYA